MGVLWVLKPGGYVDSPRNLGPCSHSDGGTILLCVCVKSLLFFPLGLKNKVITKPRRHLSEAAVFFIFPFPCARRRHRME
ncbi:MAG: hypothetical protein CM15mP120_10090 [Pseudomonadota bacterium]|nr:MAG: hypothetical protein CM15mP120_10090 [Pseudomonadota bacterium]